MKHTRIATVTMLLAFCMAIDPGAVLAGPRDSSPATPTRSRESPEEVRARKIQEMEAWLRRLVGSYKGFSRVSSTGALRAEYLRKADMPDISFWGNCASIGSGPGVHCMHSLFVQQKDLPVAPGQQEFSKVGLITQFGINPNALEIQIIIAWETGMVAESSAELRGDTVEWRWPCGNTPEEAHCTQVFRYEAPVEGDYIRIGHGFSFNSQNFDHRHRDETFLLRLSTDEIGAAVEPAAISRYSDFRDMSKRLHRPR